MTWTAAGAEVVIDREPLWNATHETHVGRKQWRHIEPGERSHPAYEQGKLVWKSNPCPLVVKVVPGLHGSLVDVSWLRRDQP